MTACDVTRGHTTTSVMTTARAAEIEAEWRDVAELSKLTPDKVIPGGELHLSSVTATNTAGYPVHSPPHTHFIKVTDMLTLFPVKSIFDFSWYTINYNQLSTFSFITRTSGAAGTLISLVTRYMW